MAEVDSARRRIGPCACRRTPWRCHRGRVNRSRNGLCTRCSWASRPGPCVVHRLPSASTSTVGPPVRGTGGRGPPRCDGTRRTVASPRSCVRDPPGDGLTFSVVHAVVGAGLCLDQGRPNSRDLASNRTRRQAGGRDPLADSPRLLRTGDRGRREAPRGPPSSEWSALRQRGHDADGAEGWRLDSRHAQPRECRTATLTAIRVDNGQRRRH